MGGTWGIYPYANNYLVYASDMSNGMYVLNLTVTQLAVPPGDYPPFFLFFSFVLFTVYPKRKKEKWGGFFLIFP
jgi:hypothetical protein